MISRVTIPALAINGTVHFLVDTGADSTLIAPRDAEELALNTAQLPEGPPSTGVGGRTPTRSIEARLTLDALTFTIPLRILAPQSARQRRALQFIPSLLGRDTPYQIRTNTSGILGYQPPVPGRLHRPV